jgi:hypothetical protein
MKLVFLFSVARSVRQRCEREERHHHPRVEGKDDISSFLFISSPEAQILDSINRFKKNISSRLNFLTY